MWAYNVGVNVANTNISASLLWLELDINLLQYGYVNFEVGKYLCTFNFLAVLFLD